MTTTILHINSSVRSTGSVSRQLTSEFIEKLQAAHPGSRVIERDLAAHPVPHLTETMMGAYFTAPEQRTSEQAQTVKLSDELVTAFASFGVDKLRITGGEPLAQKSCLPLLAALCDAGYDVCLETSGALDIQSTDPRVARIMDLKAPGSGECTRNLLGNIADLRATDEIKIVLASRADFDWAADMIRTHGLTERCDVVLSPVAGQLDPTALAEWILAEGLPVRFQIQMHKLLWSDARGK